ncbi:MAG: ATP-binding protein [Calditrichaeota bacterium]|nr:ATP-binding protein [Calditrichota bacterium]
MKYGGGDKKCVQSIKIEFDGSPELLRVVRACISEFGLNRGFNSQEIYDMNLSVNEVCANIMEHVYGWDAESKITIRIKADAEGITIWVRDYGESKDPTQFKSRNLNEMEGSGLGIFLVNELMDEVQYNNEINEGNEIIMKKYHGRGMEEMNEI